MAGLGWHSERLYNLSPTLLFRSPLLQSLENEKRRSADALKASNAALAEERARAASLEAAVHGLEAKVKSERVRVEQAAKLRPC
eukprot:355645-Chlamydomonas_euryale.AAC.40